jgi:hypothetical protein
MDRVFSVDEISDQFWSPPLPSGTGQLDESSRMNRSPSEWAFQRFLQLEVSSNATSDTSSAKSDVVVEIKDDHDSDNSRTQNAVTTNNNDNNKNNKVEAEAKANANTNANTTATASFNTPPPNIPIDSKEYQAFLKSKLNLACAAVALTRVNFFCYCEQSFYFF